MKQTLVFIAVVVLCCSAWGQSLENPYITSSGETAYKDALEQYLHTLFPENSDDAQQKLLYQKILVQNATADSFLPIPKILDQIIYNGIVQQELRTQPICFLRYIADDFFSAEGFFATRGFAVSHLSFQESQEIQPILSQKKKNWRDDFIVFMRERCCTVLCDFAPGEGTFTAREKANVTVYNLHGRCISSFSTPLQNEFKLSKLYKMRHEQIVYYRILEDFLRQILLWQVGNEFQLEFSGFDEDQKLKIDEILQEYRRLKAIVWLGNKDQNQISLCVRKDEDVIGMIHKQIIQRCQGTFTIVRKIERDRKANFVCQTNFPLLLWIAAILLGIAVAGVFLVRRKKQATVVQPEPQQEAVRSTMQQEAVRSEPQQSKQGTFVFNDSKLESEQMIFVGGNMELKKEVKPSQKSEQKPSQPVQATKEESEQNQIEPVAFEDETLQEKPGFSLKPEVYPKKQAENPIADAAKQKKNKEGKRGDTYRAKYMNFAGGDVHQNVYEKDDDV